MLVVGWKTTGNAVVQGSCSIFFGIDGVGHHIANGITASSAAELDKEGQVGGGEQGRDQKRAIVTGYTSNGCFNSCI